MKKIIYSVALLFLVSTAFSQEKEIKKMDKFSYLEFLIAFQNGSIEGSESWNGSVFGGFFGIRTRMMNFSETMGMDAGLGYSMQGGGYDSYEYIPGGESSESKATVRLNYAVIPITASYRSKKGFYAEAGLQPGILLSAKDKHNGTTDDVKDEYKGFDIGLVAGAGFRTKNNIAFGLRVVPGLTNINKTNSTYETTKDRNMVVSVSTSFRF